MATIEITDDNFDSDVLKSGKPVLLDFWASYCAPCKKMSPDLEDLAGEMADDVTIGKLNIEHNPETPLKFHVRGVPTLMIFKDGDVVATRVGALNKPDLAAWVKENT